MKSQAEIQRDNERAEEREHAAREADKKLEESIRRQQAQRKDD